MSNEHLALSLLQAPPPFLFFTGKGGVGKTSLACACALALADIGNRVLLVSTDPASKLVEMLRTPLSEEPRSIAEVPGLFAMNIDPDEHAKGLVAKSAHEPRPNTAEPRLGPVPSVLCTAGRTGRAQCRPEATAGRAATVGCGRLRRSNALSAFACVSLPWFSS